MYELNEVKTYQWWGSIPNQFIFEVSKFLRTIKANYVMDFANEDGRFVLKMDRPILMEAWIGEQYWHNAVRGFNVS